MPIDKTIRTGESCIYLSLDFVLSNFQSYFNSSKFTCVFLVSNFIHVSIISNMFQLFHSYLCQLLKYALKLSEIIGTSMKLFHSYFQSNSQIRIKYE